jgi:hypothetical protein
MRDWFSTLAAKSSLSADAVSDLAERGFVVLPGPVPSEEMNAFVAAYSAAMTSASHEDTKVGTTSTRVNDFVNRGVEFDPNLQRLCMARAHGKQVGRATTIAAGRVHPERRAHGDGLRGAHVSGNTCASGTARA